MSCLHFLIIQYYQALWPFQCFIYSIKYKCSWPLTMCMSLKLKPCPKNSSMKRKAVIFLQQCVLLKSWVFRRTQKMLKTGKLAWSPVTKNSAHVAFLPLLAWTHDGRNPLYIQDVKTHYLRMLSTLLCFCSKTQRTRKEGCRRRMGRQKR